MEEKTKNIESILFVCLGNICRSPIAHGIAEQLVHAYDLHIDIDSAGTGNWHSGEAPCENSIKVAKQNGIDISHQRARQIQESDLNHFDILIALDAQNEKDLKKMGAKNVYKLGDFGYNSQDVPDPYFFDGFDGFMKVYTMIEECVTTFLKEQKKSFIMIEEFFETIKILDAQIYHLDYHQKRYESVLKAHGREDFLPLYKYIDPPKQGLYRCKLIYNYKNNKIQTHYFAYKKQDIAKLQIVQDQEIQYRYKYLDREALDKLFKKSGSSDDILIVKNGLLTDTSKANIALLKDNKWWTPAKPLLAGTTRQRLLESQKIYEADIELKSLFSYEKIALMNAMIDFDVQDMCEILI